MKKLEEAQLMLEFAVAMQYAKTDSFSGTPEVLEHDMTSLEHYPVFCAFKSDFVQFLSDRYAEIPKQVTGTRFVLRKF